MCGIGGYVDPSGALERASVLRSIAAALVHRGPDGEGFFTHGPFGLAHRRLAIIDLSEGGSQPMRVGPIAVVFNGEIYNYRELREELRIAGQSFSGSSDTEVLARAYLQWGEQFVKRLRGMWAFAIADMRTQTLLCSRDPFGIKPFYYARHGGGLVFASEPQALIRAGVPARVNLALAAQYLALGVTDHTCETFFDGIVQLGAGESIAISADATIRSLGAQHYLESGAPATFGQFAGALQESVRLHLRSDVPVGTCLSGGLDSSTVAALASGAIHAAGGPRFAAVTAASGDPSTDERKYAAAVVAHCELDWHVVTPTPQEFAAEVDDCIRAQGEPALSPSVYFQYCVMRGAREAGLKVMLDGQGADELLGGYERYIPSWGLDVARKSGVVAALRGVIEMARSVRPGVRGIALLTAYVLLPWVRRRVIISRTRFLRPEFSGAVLEVVARISSGSAGVRSARLADLAAYSLPALLRYEDRSSMAHSIEARVPYVDCEVASCALRLPDTELMRGGFTKYPLRTVAAGVLPEGIAWRRSKIGFEPPTQRWLEEIRERLQPEITHSSAITRLCGVTPRVAELATPLRWRLYNLARWQRLFAVQVD
jgi:asparagine synthase (glutamine-hydrolysing)